MEVHDGPLTVSFLLPLVNRLTRLLAAIATVIATRDIVILTAGAATPAVVMRLLMIGGTEMGMLIQGVLQKQ